MCLTCVRKYKLAVLVVRLHHLCIIAKSKVFQLLVTIQDPEMLACTTEVLVVTLGKNQLGH